MRAVAFHQRGLLRQRLGIDHVAHHQEASHIHPQIAGDADMLLADVRLGAVGRHPHRAHADIIGAAQFLDGADTRQDQRRQHRAGQHIGDRFEPFPVGMRAEAVVEAHAGKAVTMRDLDRVHPGGIERGCDLADMINPVHVADGVHPVTQGHVLDIELVARLDVELAHCPTPPCPMRRAASSSPVALAAAVMMSRLPE